MDRWLEMTSILDYGLRTEITFRDTVFLGPVESSFLHNLDYLVVFAC